MKDEITSTHTEMELEPMKEDLYELIRQIEEISLNA
jgi:hypothetical protein